MNEKISKAHLWFGLATVVLLSIVIYRSTDDLRFIFSANQAVSGKVTSISGGKECWNINLVDQQNKNWRTECTQQFPDTGFTAQYLAHPAQDGIVDTRKSVLSKFLQANGFLLMGAVLTLLLYVLGKILKLRKAAA